MNDKALNISELIYSLKKRYKIIVICTIVITILAGVLAVFKMKPSYEAKVKIFTSKNGEIKEEYSNNELLSNLTLINTSVELIKTEDFMTKVINKSGLSLRADKLLSGLVFITSTDAPIIEIKYVASDSKTAKKVVDILADEFAIEVKEIIANVNCKIIDSTKVTEKTINKAVVILIGAIVGLLLGTGIVLILAYLDNTVSSKFDLQKLLPVPVLGEIPIEGKELDDKLLNSNIKGGKDVYCKEETKVYSSGSL